MGWQDSVLNRDSNLSGSRGGIQILTTTLFGLKQLTNFFRTQLVFARGQEVSVHLKILILLKQPTGSI